MERARMFGDSSTTHTQATDFEQHDNPQEFSVQQTSEQEAHVQQIPAQETSLETHEQQTSSIVESQEDAQQSSSIPQEEDNAQPVASDQSHGTVTRSRHGILKPNPKYVNLTVINIPSEPHMCIFLMKNFALIEELERRE
ncbi:uncharacterized protein A4U43_C05F16700 [Asparagus officinalis]|uniref:Uncharacterized protein n=1 Tax=Asparagus officinalis TaxID=4686 RepID=A0A5P1ET58_ASPOF|nr:uncharacterized protein A4U43_C05F16700 [Asparagus officinalis]